MSNIVISLYTSNHIGTKEKAEGFFQILKKYNILPEKIGLCEPLNENYSLDKAVQMWTISTGNEPDFRLGMVIGKKKEPSVRFDISWHIGEKARANYLSVWFTKKSFKKLRNEVGDLFKDLIIYFNAFYGFITEYSLKAKQHVTGTIEERMPGIFWCNYFSDVYIDFFGKSRILNASWFKTESLNEKGIITYLAQEPDKELLESNELEIKLKEQLGKECFGDVEEFKLNLKPQIKNVPKLDLSELRKPLSFFIKGPNHKP